MKVLKFGGASVGSIKNLQQVKRIVEGVNEPVVIVVSAVENVTDMLIDTTTLAAKGNASYTEKLDTIITTHNQLIEGLMSAPLCEEVKKEVSTLHEELQNILKGVYLIKDLTAKTEDVILSYGERISSLIISKFLGAKFLDSRNFIKTNNSLGNANVDSALPYNWIDRPPSVIKVLGAKWLGNLVYPEYFDYDIVAEAKEFFRLFYGWELKDEQLNNILAASR